MAAAGAGVFSGGVVFPRFAMSKDVMSRCRRSHSRKRAPSERRYGPALGAGPLEAAARISRLSRFRRTGAQEGTRARSLPLLGLAGPSEARRPNEAAPRAQGATTPARRPQSGPRRGYGALEAPSVRVVPSPTPGRSESALQPAIGARMAAASGSAAQSAASRLRNPATTTRFDRGLMGRGERRARGFRRFTATGRT